MIPATLLNLHVVLVAYGLYSFPVIFTVLSIILGIYINIVCIKKYKSFIPAIVFVWTLIGIIFAQDNQYILITASLGILVLIGIMGAKFKSHKHSIKKKA